VRDALPLVKIQVRAAVTKPEGWDDANINSLKAEKDLCTCLFASVWSGFGATQRNFPLRQHLAGGDDAASHGF
jgi:hypothetical protein